jgi:hypothetical protein
MRGPQIGAFAFRKARGLSCSMLPRLPSSLYPASLYEHGRMLGPRLERVAARHLPVRESRPLPPHYRAVCARDLTKLHAARGKRNHRCVCAARFPPNNARSQHLLAHLALRRGSFPSRRFQLDDDGLVWRHQTKQSDSGLDLLSCTRDRRQSHGTVIRVED